MQYHKKGNNMPQVQPVEEVRSLTRIKLAAGITLAAESECFTPTLSAESKEKWIKEHDLFVTGGRAFALVDTATYVYFMDAVTGTLYQFGECLTSSDLKYRDFTRDNDKAAKILMALEKVNHANAR